jgi:hypothetical protein
METVPPHRGVSVSYPYMLIISCLYNLYIESNAYAKKQPVDIYEKLFTLQTSMQSIDAKKNMK